MFNRHICREPGTAVLDDEILVEFPVGWVTDMTSSPWWARTFVPQLGPHVPAVLLHDRLLNLDYDRDTCRFWLREQLKLLPKVPRRHYLFIVAGTTCYDYLLKFISLVRG